MVLLRVLVFLVGLAIVTRTVFSAIETFILPRDVPDRLARLSFLSMRIVFSLPLSLARTYERRDRIMALYAPITLILLVPLWYSLILIGYMLMYWSLGIGSWYESFYLSGSSLLTLGFAEPSRFPTTLLVFSEATLGLILVALLIAYLPTMYAAFSRREAAVTLLEVRAGVPPSAVEMILRFNRIHGLENLGELWQAWEIWFAEIDESHTSLPALVFFRSPRAENSWVTAAGTVLDAAALTYSSIDIPEDPNAALCIRAGFLALRHIADYFRIPHNPDPHFPQDSISVTLAEFEEAYHTLSTAGVPMKRNLGQAWLDYAGWRVNYDKVLLALASLTMAPDAPWSSDRAPISTLPPTF